LQDNTAGYTNTAIVVLTDLSKTGAVELSAIVDDNQIEKSITIKGGGAKTPTLTRIAPVEGDSDKNDRVLKVSGGAKIKFENIIINGITDNPDYYHGALAIGEAAVSEDENPPISRVTLGNGAVITGKKDGITGYVNIAESNAGSGVFTGLYGELVMEQGSKVTKCETSGGTYAYAPVVAAGGTFTMNGGEISINTIDKITETARGGGVYVGLCIINQQILPYLLYFPGEFTMTGGEISGNNTSVSGNNAYGGGVYVSGGTNQYAEEGFKDVFVKFTMKDGKISGNTVAATGEVFGGGVYVGNYGIFDMSDSEISLNKVSNNGTSYEWTNTSGGGVYVAQTGEFNMTKSRITGNEAETTTSQGSARGGGVFVYYNSSLLHTKFNMISGEISGNKTTAANANGGGVYLASSAFYDHADFTMEGGAIIYGAPTSADDKKGNIATSGAALVVTHEKQYNTPDDFYNEDITQYPITE
jgi:hypothetical protein